MAKRKIKRVSRRPLRVYKTTRRRRSAGSSKLNIMDSFVIPAGYGYTREMLNQQVQNVAGNIPLVGQSDEIGLMALGYVAKKFVKNKTVGKFADKMISVEAYNLGRNFSAGNSIFGGASQSTGGYPA